MNMNILKELYNTRDQEPYYLFVGKKDYEPLIQAGYVQVDPEFNNGKNGFMRKCATQLTATGLSFCEKEFGNPNDIPHITKVDETIEETVTTKKGASMSFEIKTSVGVPTISRKGVGRVSKYPFDQLPEPSVDANGVEQYSYFEIEGADAVKKIQSAMAVANKRFSEETGETKVTRKGNTVPIRRQIRQFICRAAEGGARVYRVL